MKLATRVTGHGPDVVLVHGWGLNSAVWDGIDDDLANSYRVTRVDLPGHGRSQWRCTDHETWYKHLARVVPAGATLVGWSLGAMLAIEIAAKQRRLLSRLVLIAATPKFVTDERWRHAVTPDVLTGFAGQLTDDFRATVQTFLALQVRGEEHAVSTLRRLRRTVFKHSPPEPETLAAGLEYLRTVDLAALLHHIDMPTLVISGERDRLCPPEAGRHIASKVGKGSFVLLERAGHAPFLSHRDEFLVAVRDHLGAAQARDRTQS